MKGCILITGGAGFIGSHLADELLRHGYRVRVLDSLIPQVHGPDAVRPRYLDPQVELVKGDVRDPAAVKRALEGADAVFHLAAMVGVGQSMYEIEKYTSVNNSGTAVLLEALSQGGRERKLIVASSMSIYGEGRYRDGAGRLYDDVQPVEQLKAGHWEPTNGDQERLFPVPTPEGKAPSLASVYTSPNTTRSGWRSSSAIATASRWSPSASSTCTAPGRRSRTPTPAYWRSSPPGA